jgi:hypothetical protein
MSGHWLRLVAVHTSCALVLGCGGAQLGPGEAREVKAGPTRLTGATTIPLAAAVIEQQSTTSIREEAFAELAQRLAEQLVDAEWASQFQRVTLEGVDWLRWLESNGVVRQVGTGRGYSATLNAGQVERILDAVGRLEPVVDARLPAAWQPTLSSAFVSERNWTLCQARQRWLSVPCATEPPLADRMALSNLLADVQLEPLLRDGVPVRKDGALAWPAAVRVTQGLQALNGLPVHLVAPDAASEAATPRALAARDDETNVAVSDDRGTCRFSTPHIDVGTQAAVDLAALLGPLAKSVELPAVNVYTRALDPKRHVVVEVSNGGERAPLAASPLGSSVQRELAASYGAQMPALSRELERHIQTDAVAVPPSHDPISERLREQIVEATHGAIDYLVLTWGHSEFASQMGAGRTWYEARVGTKVIEVWSRATVAVLEDSATGAGMGDAAAEQAALDAAAHKLALRVQTALADAPR